MISKVVGSLVDAAEQTLAADRNQRASHRQLAAGPVVARPLKRGVGLLSPSIVWERVMDLKHLIYEDDVIAVGFIAFRYENAKEEILSLVIRYLPPKTYHSKDGALSKTTNNMGGTTDWFVLPSSFAAPIGRKLIEQKAAGLPGFDEDGFALMVRWLVDSEEIDDAMCY